MRIYIIIISLLLLLISCEYAPPTEYIPEIYVEGYLIVDEPIRNIVVMNSQPVQSTYNYENSLIRNAEYVRIIEGTNEYVLTISDSGETGYYYPDTTVLIKPQTEYSLDIKLASGKIITAKTKTPKRLDWIKPPADTIYYPKDTLDLPEVDTLEFYWDRGWLYYFIRIKCLDTLGYGEYLTPQTEEENRRIIRPWGEGSRDYNDVNRWVGPILNNKSPVVWNALKWYGRNEVSVYAPDYNFLSWFIHYQRSGFYEPLLSSIDGAMGVFGSASVVRKESFIIKNQP